MSFRDFQNRLTENFKKQTVINIPLGRKILQGNITLRGPINISAVVAGGTQIGEGGPVGLIDRIILHATPAPGSRYPGGEIIDVCPRSLLRHAIYEHQGKYIADQAGVTLSGTTPPIAAAVGVYNVNLNIPIYFADSVLESRDASTALNADPTAYQSLQLEIRTYQDLSNCFNGFNGTVDLSGLTFEWTDERVDIPTDTNVLYQTDDFELIGAAQQRMQLRGLPMDGRFLSWLIMTQLNTPANALSDTILNWLQFEGDPFSIKLRASDIRQKMLNDGWIDASQNAAGQYFIDWTDGVLGNSIVAGTMIGWLDVNNPSGANNDSLLIYTRRIIPPIPAKGN